MSEDQAFADLIRRVRARDEQAAAELVRRYERAIRVAVRVRLNAPDLRSLLDSTDLCQSVLASFFVRVAVGQYDLDTPEQLLKLLTRMARHKLANQARRQRAARRDRRRLQPGPAGDGVFVAPDPSPSQVVADRELVREFYGRLSPEDQWLADQRALGRRWAEIAAEIGVHPDTLRMRLTRACDEVARTLRLDE
jgi:RNA polymerase sigma-70 factor (ECF subfamily)